MKVLAFSCAKDDEIYQKQVLPSLLSGKKTQTIRPAWKVEERIQIISPNGGNMVVKEMVSKEPFLKVGDSCQLVWKCRSSPKGSNFCSTCGVMIKDWIGRPEPWEIENLPCGHKIGYFEKVFGHAEITEVFKIEMLVNGIYFPNVEIGKKEGGYSFKTDYVNWDELDDFAIKDGFKDSYSMFTWFDKRYDLNTKKPFYIYRWKPCPR